MNKRRIKDELEKLWLDRCDGKVSEKSNDREDELREMLDEYREPESDFSVEVDGY